MCPGVSHALWQQHASAQQSRVTAPYEPFRNLLIFMSTYHTRLKHMTCLPQPHSNCRATRVRPANLTPAVLRFRDGCRTQGKLEVISLTGGLLALSKPLAQGSRVKLMFLTHTGPVLGAAEMLSPVSWSQQPFRFVALEEDDQRRLRTEIQLSLNPGVSELFAQELENSRIIDAEQQWIEKYRSALSQRNPPRRRLFRVVLAAVTFATLCLGSALYLFSIHLK